ncbi:sugar transferase [Microvirga arabica]|nr:sugar transferase [Microvirga arabica]
MSGTSAHLDLMPRTSTANMPVGGRSKRTFDIAVALAAAVLLLPLMLLIALLIKLFDGGTIIFRHRRIGYRGGEFDCLKFRTMHANGDTVLERYFANSPAAHQEWLEKRKLTHDPRVTKIGAILRKTSLDELPQILNVLKGEMSIVGPRPVVHDEIALYGTYSHYYLQSRPGLTGAWQIGGRSNTSYSHRVALDVAYVEQWSMRTDFWIVVRTIPVVLTVRDSC